MPRPASAWPTLIGGLVACLTAPPLVAQPWPPLPALGLEARSVTVSGLSSGGYMAAQFEVAHARTLAGAAIVAGGPYGCSGGSVISAALTCSCPYDDASTQGGPLGLAAWTRDSCTLLPAWVLSQRARRALAGNAGHIDPPAALRRHRVWLYSGDADPVVDPHIVDGLQQFYTDVGVPARQIHRTRQGGAGHAMPLPASGACGVTRSPYLNDCGYDGAGELLRWLYPQSPTTPGTAQATALRRFDQTPYRQSGVFDGLDDSGWVYIPAACESAQAHCRLHVAFHGCEQGQSFRANGRPFGDTFVQQAGYNRWAERLNTVVLYPQVRPSEGATLGSPYAYNPKGCWDFWGYTSPEGDAALHSSDPPFARQEAPQIRAVKAMIDALLQRP